MKRLHLDWELQSMSPAIDGEYILYAEHVEAMKRIAGAPVAPEGWKLIPVEPTKEMWYAVNKLDDEMAAGSYDGKGCSIEQAWNCMLAAAPSASAQQAEPVDGCTEENCRRCRTPEGLRTPDMYHAGLSAAAEIADEVCANSRNHLFRSGAKVVAGAIRSAAPAPSASPAKKPRVESYYERRGATNPVFFGVHDAKPAASPADQAEKPDAFAVFRTGFKTTRVYGPDSLYEISVKYRNIDDLHAADDELRAAMSASKEGA